MIEILYKKKLIRDFLSLFNQDKWRNIVVCLVEYSIIMMKRSNINISILSYEDLINLVEQYKIEMKIIDKPVLSKNNFKGCKSLSNSKSKSKSKTNYQDSIKKHNHQNSNSKFKSEVIYSNSNLSINKDQKLRNSKNGLTISNKHEVKNGNKSNLSSSPDIRDSGNISPSFVNNSNLSSNKLHASLNSKIDKNLNLKVKENMKKTKGAKNLYLRHLEKNENLPGNIITLGSNSDKSFKNQEYTIQNSNIKSYNNKKDKKNDIKEKTRNYSSNQKTFLTNHSKSSKSKFQALELKQIEKLKQKRKDIEQQKSVGRIVNDSINNDYKFNLNDTNSIGISNLHVITSNVNNANMNVKSKIKNQISNDKKIYQLCKDKYTSDKFSIIEDIKVQKDHLKNENESIQISGSSKVNDYNNFKQRINFLDNSDNFDNHNDISLRDKYSNILNKKSKLNYHGNNENSSENFNKNEYYNNDDDYNQRGNNNIYSDSKEISIENVNNNHKQFVNYPNANIQDNKNKYQNENEYYNYHESNYKKEDNICTENSLKQYHFSIDNKENKNYEYEERNTTYNKTSSNDNIIKLAEIEKNSENFSKLLEKKLIEKTEENIKDQGFKEKDDTIIIKNEKIQQIINSKFNEYLTKIKKEKGISFNSNQNMEKETDIINKNNFVEYGTNSCNNVEFSNVLKPNNLLKEDLDKEQGEYKFNMPLQSTLNNIKK